MTPSSNGFNLWVMGPDGRNQRALTRSGHDAEPDLSPDGTRITWVVANSQLWTMSSDGTAAAQVASCPQACGTPRWSPDGTRIAYTSMSRTSADVVVITAAGATPRHYNVVNAYSAAWSPDGTRLAVTVSGPGTGLSILDVAGGTQRKIRAERSTAPSWSPDGRLLLISDGSAMFTLSPDGTGVRQLTSGAGQYLGGSWSADGRVIAFAYYPGIVGAHEQVWTMTADGTGRRQLTDGTSDDYEASF